MHLTIAVSGRDDQILTLDVGPDMTVADLKAVIQVDTNVPPSSQILHFNGAHLVDDSRTLASHSIGDGEMISMTVFTQQAPRGGQRAGGAASQSRGQPSRGRNPRNPGDDAEILRLQALGDPRLMSQMQQSRPELADAVQDPRVFREQFLNMMAEEDRINQEKEEAIRQLNEDPFNAEAQAKIEEMIRQENVNKNLQQALENTPEAFGRVHMLYIDVEVNGHKVKAFVDSGAQATIMSPDCAEKCGIMRLVDNRYAGIARGVGTAKIIGRVHSAQIKIGKLFLPCAFTVMEGKDVDLLLGLDMLKRHQVSIDLRKNRLCFENEEVPFLGEADSPRGAEITGSSEPTVKGPAGTKVGGITGAVMPTSEPSGPSTIPQPQASALTTPQPSQAQSTSQYSLSDIEQLMSMGFSREEAIGALDLAGGNLEMAAGILYG